MRVPAMGLTASSFRFSQPILASAEPAPPVARRLRRLRRLRLLTTGQDDRRYTGQVHCRRPSIRHKPRDFVIGPLVERLKLRLYRRNFVRTVYLWAWLSR